MISASFEGQQILEISQEHSAQQDFNMVCTVLGIH